ncbi:MAG TPA: hypothetical protein VK186_25540, partial [Candidatus Deferrimicrobium sp.]|nr:hypothetical protein [Candidatus Deferrimicrobium sp.]
RMKNYPYVDEVANDDLMKKILRQLEKISANAEIYDEISNEELADLYYSRTIGKRDRQLAEKEKALEEKEKELLNSQKELEEKERLIRELMAKIGK